MRKTSLIISVAALGALALLGAGCVKNNQASTTANVEPSISVSEQSLGANNQITINKASIGSNGWIVIHAVENGQPGAVLGYTSLSAGNSTKIKISIDKAGVSPTLIAMLHYDRGQQGVFEFPGADGPVIKDQKVIMQEFNLTNYAELTKQPAPATAGARKEFVITAKQWSFSPSEIRVKKGDTVVLKLKSTDVMHGFSLPDFGINQPLKPGETVTVQFVANKVGTFKFICNVPCGVGHIGMTGTIVVEE